MREVQASCSSDLDLGQAGRAREGGGGLSVFYFLCLLCLWFLCSLFNGRGVLMGAAATVNVFLGLKM